MIKDPSKYEELADEAKDLINHLAKEKLSPDTEDIEYFEERIDVLEAGARAKQIPKKENRVEKYITFREKVWFGVEEKKTKTWWVDSSNGGKTTVGEIRWHGAWRKYCFYPSDSTLYDPDCLRLIADFIETETKEHYANNKRLKVLGKGSLSMGRKARGLATKPKPYN